MDSADFDAETDAHDPPHDPHEEHRHHDRRDEDRMQREMEGWVAKLFVHRGKLVVLASAITFTFTTLGYRVLGPSQDIKALDQKFTARDSAMGARVTRIEDRQDAISARLVSIEEQVRFVAFLQCTQLRTTNPNLALDGCPRRP